MARAGIISVDGHVKARRATYRDYIDPGYHGQFDEWMERVDGTPDGFVRPQMEDGQWDPQKRLTDLAPQGVVAEVLFANGTAFAEPGHRTLPPELTRQANLAYNRWLVDFCAEGQGRLLGQALVNFDDVDQAVADVHWAKEHGLGGIQMPPLTSLSKFFFDPALDPIWAAVQEVGLPLSQHGGTGAPDYQPAGFAAIMVLATEHSFYSGRSMWQMMLGGVFDRFPDLKLAFVETEAWWIRPMIEHLDKRMNMGDEWTEFADFMKASGASKRLASEYWATNCYAGISPFHPAQISVDELGTKDVDESGGFRIHSGNAMFGVDYPHFESIFPDTMEHVATLVGNPHVTEDDARKILYENAAEVYAFDLAALQPTIDEWGFELDDLVPAPA
ncbi:MAG: amidohydrolase family protein [Acidimicrobiales bacterium]